jgi:uncharacterized protein (TIRG00374 family)
MQEIDPNINPPIVAIDKKRMFFYVITFATIVVVYFHLDELNLIANLFKSANALWLFAIIGSQSLFYYFLALNYKYVLKLKDTDIVPMRELIPMSIVVQFINQVLPSASISGQAFFVYFLRKYKITIPEAIGRAILEIMTMFMTFGIYLFIGIMLMNRHGIFVIYPEALIIVYAFLALAVFWVSVFYIMQSKRATEGRLARWMADKFKKYVEKMNNSKNRATQVVATHAPHVGSFFDQLKISLDLKKLRKNGKIFWLALLWQNLSFFGNVLTVFFAAYALGVPISIEVAFITFAFARFAAAIVTIPSGIGIYESVSTFALVIFGIDVGTALAISLVTRAFTFWLPIPIGWAVYHRMTYAIESQLAVDKT